MLPKAAIKSIWSDSHVPQHMIRDETASDDEYSRQGVWSGPSIVSAVPDSPVPSPGEATGEIPVFKPGTMKDSRKIVPTDTEYDRLMATSPDFKGQVLLWVTELKATSSEGLSSKHPNDLTDVEIHKIYHVRKYLYGQKLWPELRMIWRTMSGEVRDAFNVYPHSASVNLHMWRYEDERNCHCATGF